MTQFDRFPCDMWITQYVMMTTCLHVCFTFSGRGFIDAAASVHTKANDRYSVVTAYTASIFQLYISSLVSWREHHGKKLHKAVWWWALSWQPESPWGSMFQMNVIRVCIETTDWHLTICISVKFRGRCVVGTPNECVIRIVWLLSRWSDRHQTQQSLRILYTFIRICTCGAQKRKIKNRAPTVDGD